MTNRHDELHDWIARFREGQLTAEEAARLNNRLATDAEACELWVSHLLMQTLLDELARDDFKGGDFTGGDGKNEDGEDAVADSESTAGTRPPVLGFLGDGFLGDGFLGDGFLGELGRQG